MAVLVLFNITHIVYTQRGATNIPLSIFTDLYASMFHFHLDVIKDREYLYNKIQFSEKVSPPHTNIYIVIIYLLLYNGTLIYFDTNSALPLKQLNANCCMNALYTMITQSTDFFTN